MMKNASRMFTCLGLSALVALSACKKSDEQSGAPSGTSGKLSGNVIVDGSSTVFPVSEAVGEEFQSANRGVKVAVASSGTGGGFQKFCSQEIDIAGASRPIE